MKTKTYEIGENRVLKYNKKKEVITICDKRFTAFSLQGQFAPRSESANRTLANSLPGTFAPWRIRFLALSLPGTFAPGPFCSLAFSLLDYNRIIFAALAYIGL